MRTVRLIACCVALLVAAPSAWLQMGQGGARAQETSRTFAETGQTVRGKFLQYWNEHGGLAQQGYPISDELWEKSDTDGKTYTVQYFERAVFEMHPENAAAYNVLLSLLGTFAYAQKYPNGAAWQRVSTEPGARRFTETGHTVGGKFLGYWNEHGGLAQQGYPISDEFTEVSDLNGKPYTVQYFERAVFELHAENPAPYDVLLSQLGTARYRARSSAADRIANRTALPGLPAKIALGGGFVWVALSDENHGGSLVRVDPATQNIVGTPEQIGFEPHGLSFGEGGVWVSQESTIARFDPSTGKRVASIAVTVHSNYVPVLAAEGSVWFADPAEEVSTVMRIDPSTNSVVGQPIKVGQEPLFLVAGGGAVWVGSHDSDSISRIDPGTNKVVATINTSFNVHGLAYDDGSLWVADYHGHKVARVDPAQNRMVDEPAEVDYSFEAISAGSGMVWTAPDHFANDARRGDDRVTRLDARSGKIVGVLHAGGTPTDVLVGEKEVWVTTAAPNMLLRVEP